VARAEPDRSSLARKPSAAAETKKTPRESGDPSGEGALLDVFLTAPVFLLYHAGVVFLSVRNGLDPVTDLLLSVLDRSLLGYLGLTLGAAAAFFVTARVIGLQGKLRPKVFALRIGEAAIYAFAMWAIAQMVVQKTLGPAGSFGPFTALIMSLGAGFYEEVGFRVILFGLGSLLIRKMFKPSPAKEGGGGIAWRAIGFELVWAFVCATAFSAIHYTGSMGDKFQLGSFVFRLTCGLVLTAVYRWRGFATAVWTHALYDVGVMVL